MSFRALVAFVVAVLFTGCTTTELRYIKPTELPRLSGVTTGTVVNGSSAGASIAVPTRTVETPEGRLIEVNGGFDVVVRHTGRELTFERPIRAELSEAGNVTIWSSNRDPWTAPVGELERVAVRQEEAGNAWATLIVAITLPVLLVLALEGT